MKRKILALTLALLLCVGLAPAAVFGADDVSISVDTSSYAKDENISVTVSGVTSQMISTYAYVSIYDVGAAHEEYQDWKTLTEAVQTVPLWVQDGPGTYEVRVYREDGNYTDESFVTSVRFTVGKSNPQAGAPDPQGDPTPPAAVTETPVASATVVPGSKDQVVLNVDIRDFKADGILFEGDIESSEGLVSNTLGSDGKPVYNLSRWKELFGEGVRQDMLDAFFNNQSGVNKAAKKTITLNADKQGYYVIDSAVDGMGKSADGFFPIDGELFGNEGNDHNFHFSMELHATFQYKKGDTFEFVGDDDVWAFFNGKLCVDLGGVHSAAGASVSIDDLVAQGKLNIKPGDYVAFDMFYMERHLTESNLYVKTNIDFVNFNNSAWATKELFEAYENDLIPDVLMDENLTLPVYRDEFAATAVKLYEAMAGVKAAEAKSNPFTDTKDGEILKAYELGIVKGISDTTFSPRAMLTRQEAATMLTRVYKAAKLSGWSIDKDSEFKLEYTKPAAFADDTRIDGWAKDSVYFMVANGVIQGMGDNKFGPKNVTEAEKAKNYGNATREASLIISVRAFENLK